MLTATGPNGRYASVAEPTDENDSHAWSMTDSGGAEVTGGLAGSQSEARAAAEGALFGRVLLSPNPSDDELRQASELLIVSKPFAESSGPAAMAAWTVDARVLHRAIQQRATGQPLGREESELHT